MRRGALNSLSRERRLVIRDILNINCQVRIDKILFYTNLWVYSRSLFPTRPWKSGAGLALVKVTPGGP